MQPFNYMIDGGNPGQAFAQAFQQQRLMGQQREQQELQKAQSMRLQNALSGLGPNASPADFMGLVQQFPDLAEPLTKQYRTFDDARKNGLFSAGERAFMLLRPGADGTLAVDEAVASLEESAAAFENSGQPDIAKQLRDSAKAAKINPAAARTALGTMLAFADPDRMKKIGEASGKAEDTAFQRDYAFIRSTFGQDAADKFANTKIDEQSIIPLPGGRVYVGPRSGIAAAMGGSPVPTPSVRIGTIEDGYRFKGGDPAKPENWEKVR